MRVLVVSHAFGPESNAGTEQVAAGTIVALQERGVEVGLLAAFYKIPTLEVLPVNLDEAHFFPITKRKRAALWSDWNARARRHFRRVLRQYRPDVVYFHHTLFLSFDLPLIAARQGVRTVFMLHDFWLICPRSTLLAANGTLSWQIDRHNRCADCLALNHHPATARWPLIRQLFNPFVARQLLRRRDRQTAALFQTVDAFISPSKTVADALQRRGLPSNKLHVIPYGIPPLRHTRPTPSDQVRFGFIGSIVRHKGVAELIRAFSQVSPEEATLTIWGPAHKPVELDGIGQFAHINFAGPFDPQQTQEIYDQIDALIVPSIWFENQPLVILQAYATGTPVIATNLGGMRELIHHERDGLLFKPGELVETLRRFSLDGKLRRRLRVGARQRRIPTPQEQLDQILPILKGE